MREWALVAVVTTAFLAPAFAGAEEICQNKNTGQISKRKRCNGKYRSVLALEDLVTRVETLEAQLALATGSATDELAEIEARLNDGFAALTLLNARFPVASADIRANAVNSDKVQDGSLGPADLGADSVNGSKIQDGAVAAAELAADAVSGAKVQDGSLGLEDLASPLVVPHPSAGTGEHWRFVTAELDLDGTDAATVGVADAADDWLELSLLNAPGASVEFTIGDGVFAEEPRCLGGLAQTGSPDAAQNLEVSLVAPNRIQVRVVGSDRQLNVRATLLCAGLAGDV
jgi:hypothetical protein